MRRIIASLAMLCALLQSQDGASLTVQAAPASQVTFTCDQQGFAVTPPAGWGYHGKYDPTTLAIEQASCIKDQLLSFQSVDSRAAVLINALPAPDTSPQQIFIRLVNRVIHPKPQLRSYYHMTIGGNDWLVASIIGHDSSAATPPTDPNGKNAERYSVYAMAAANGIVYLFDGTVSVPNRSYKPQVQEVLDTLKSTSLFAPKGGAKPQPPAPAATATPSVGSSQQPVGPSNKAFLKSIGTGNTQTATFYVTSPFNIVWVTDYQDASLGSLLFVIELYASDGTPLDLVANTTDPDPKGNGITEHADCSAGCYLQVTAFNVVYGIGLYKH